MDLLLKEANWIRECDVSSDVELAGSWKKMAKWCDENKLLRLFRRANQAPGGRRTSLSPNVRKSVASFEELRGVLSFAEYNSAV